MFTCADIRVGTETNCGLFENSQSDDTASNKGFVA